MNCQGCDNEINDTYALSDMDCDIWWCKNCGSIAVDCRVDGVIWDKPNTIIKKLKDI